jgi:serine protease AprX
MFGYSMVKIVRTHGEKMEKTLRELLLNMYRPFKWVPCFMHSMIEDWMKQTKKLGVMIEFDQAGGSFDKTCSMMRGMMERYPKCAMRQEFSRVSCISLDVTPAALEDILESMGNVKRIYMNREVHALLDQAIPSANAQNVVREGTALTGKGVTIVVMDTGIYPHRDLQGRIAGFVDFINQRTAPYDDNGHGTHCAGDAAGNGMSSGGRYKGAAPEADVIGIKVLDSTGAGSLETVMQGMEWCIRYNENPANRRKIDIISLSLGSPAQWYGNENSDPVVQYAEAAWNSGIVVCAAAGNEGPDRRTISSPGISDQIITVGALDDRNTSQVRSDDDVAVFSSRGPTPYGITKPDLLVPGVNIISLRSPNSYLDRAQKSSRVGSSYFVMSGTSMATPICAGIAALMLQNEPNLSPEEVKRRLKEGADLWEERDPNVYGAGYVNADKSIPK